MAAPSNLVEFLERCLAAVTTDDVREAALDLPAVIPGEVVWLGELDVSGRELRVWSRDLTPDEEAALRALHQEHPLLHPAAAEPRTLSSQPDREAFRRSDLATGLHAVRGIEDELLIPLGGERSAAFLVLGRAQAGFTEDELGTAGLVQAVVSAALRRAADREPVRLAQRAARRELRTRARTLVLLVDGDGKLRGEGVDQLSADARDQVEALLGEPPSGPGAGLPGRTASREIMLVRNSADAATGLMSLKVLPADADGISCVLVRLPADAGHLAEHGLSGRQAEVMALVLAGLDPACISERLGISQATVRKHAENTYRTLGVRSLTEFALRVL